LKRVAAILRSAALARGVLLYLGAFIGLFAWAPWVRGSGAAPAWAAAVGLEAPFSSAWFIAGVAALFSSTVACTWGRRGRVAAQFRGELPANAVALPAGHASAEAFLRAHAFRRQRGGEAWFRFRLALWGGWVFHVGLLVLIAAVAVQQAFHDAGSFELTVGERVVLSEPGAVFARTRGPFAPSLPPHVRVTLLDFDPWQRQAGYAPDRRSLLELGDGDARPRQARVDRADGVRSGTVVLYQAIPSGVAVNLAVEGLGRRSIHLRDDPRSPRLASASVVAPGGEAVLLEAEAERDLHDPGGTGAVRLRAVSTSGAEVLRPAAPFRFGGARARVESVTWWGGFTYARDPGMSGIFVGFAVMLFGAAFMVLPAGVARVSGAGDDAAARIFVTRGEAALRAAWVREQPAAERERA
jgi:hypothetical protein